MGVLFELLDSCGPGHGTDVFGEMVEAVVEMATAVGIDGKAVLTRRALRMVHRVVGSDEALGGLQTGATAGIHVEVPHRVLAQMGCQFLQQVLRVRRPAGNAVHGPEVGECQVSLSLRHC